MSDDVRQVLSRVPGWDGASTVELAGGLTNRSWLVRSGRRKAVLKIDAELRGDPFNARPVEARIQGRAAAAGLANNVIFATDTAYMTEFAEGTVWSAGSLEDDANLAKLAVALRELHSLPLTGRTFDAIGAARNYAARIRHADTGRVHDCLRKIEAMPLPHNLCCCHNDLVAANIIVVPEVRFLDWEYACDNDPFFDLATIVAHHKLPPDRADFLLDAYFNGDGRRWREQLTRQAEFYDALLWLWAASRAA